MNTRIENYNIVFVVSINYNMEVSNPYKWKCDALKIARVN